MNDKMMDANEMVDVCQTMTMDPNGVPNKMVDGTQTKAVGRFDIKQFFASRPVLLAPMAGVNDPVFRSICKRMGATLTYSEMISAKGLAYGNTRTDDMLLFFEDEAPFAVQLFGNEPAVLAATAVQLEKRLAGNLAFIDINMGCPARKVTGKGDGAALLRTPELAREIISAVSNAIQTPLTVKIRKGFELDEDIAVEFACMAQEAGAAAVTVHGRTAHQFYKGVADRFVIDRVVNAVSIPVIASGDVYARTDIEDYFARGAAGVMVARGACGNPWIFSSDRKTNASYSAPTMYSAPTICSAPTIKERVALAWEHTSRLYEVDPKKLVSMRRHIAWYFKATPYAAAIRRSLNDCKVLEDYQTLLEAVMLWY